MPATKVVSDKKAIRDVVQWVTDEADLDDLARIYSQLFAEGPVIVIGGGGAESEEFIDGRRVTTVNKKGRG